MYHFFVFSYSQTSATTGRLYLLYLLQGRFKSCKSCFFIFFTVNFYFLRAMFISELLLKVNKVYIMLIRWIKISDLGS